MASVQIALIEVCAGGNHVDISLAIDDSATQTLHYTADELSQPITDDFVRDAVLSLLRLHFKGMTRQQARAALQAGVNLTI
jgi:DNA-nicking Smr family endonuclease